MEWLVFSSWTNHFPSSAWDVRACLIRKCLPHKRGPIGSPLGKCTHTSERESLPVIKRNTCARLCLFSSSEFLGNKSSLFTLLCRRIQPCPNSYSQTSDSHPQQWATQPPSLLLPEHTFLNVCPQQLFTALPHGFKKKKKRK